MGIRAGCMVGRESQEAGVEVVEVVEEQQLQVEGECSLEEEHIV